MECLYANYLEIPIYSKYSGLSFIVYEPRTVEVCLRAELCVIFSIYVLCIGNIGSGSVSRMLDFCCSYLDDELVGPCNSSPASPVTPQDKQTEVGRHPLTRSRALSSPVERTVTAQKSLPLSTNLINGKFIVIHRVTGYKNIVGSRENVLITDMFL